MVYQLGSVVHPYLKEIYHHSPPLNWACFLPHNFDLFGWLYDDCTAKMSNKHRIVSYSNSINIIYHYYPPLQWLYYYLYTICWRVVWWKFWEAVKIILGAGINNSSPGRQIYRSTVYIVFMSMVILPTWTSISEGDISILSPNPLIAIDVYEWKNYGIQIRPSKPKLEARSFCPNRILWLHIRIFIGNIGIF